MKKRLVLAVLVLSLVFTSAFAMLSPSAVSTAEDYVVPEVFIPEYMPTVDSDFLTDATDTVIGAGTRYEQNIHAGFLPADKEERPGTKQNQSFIVVHNTGSYPASADALNMFNYCHNTDADVSWHFSVGNDGIYQQLPINEKGWHAGGSYWDSGTTQADNCPKDNYGNWAGNSNSVGIETCVDGFPATNTASGEMWDKPEMFEWYETHYDKTATYLAQLVANLCVRMNFNPYTQIVQHFNTAAKNCPMQMRYVFGSNGTKFQVMGTYYTVFLDRMYDYYEAIGGSYTSADTIKNVYYNSDYSSYDKGLYTSTSAITAYAKPNDGAAAAGTIAAGQACDVQIVSNNWGKTTLANGTKAWIKLDGLTYSAGALGAYMKSDGTVVDVTNISGNTATYAGGTASLATLTKAYKVTVKSATNSFTDKYYKVGSVIDVTAVAAVAPNLFDIWEVTYGAATIEDKTASTTTFTVVNSDVVIEATYRDKYDLKVTSGRGSGRYSEGAEIEIASSSKVGYKFSHWSLVSGSGTFADANSSTTTFTIGSADTVIEANYNINMELDVTGLENYALNKSYQSTWKNVAGNSSDCAYYTSLAGYTDYEMVRLTDGLTASIDSYQAPQMVAFQGTKGECVININLGKAYDITKLLICDLPDSGGSWADMLEGSLKIFYSMDNETWNTVDFFEDQLFYSYIGEKRCSNVFTHGIELGNIQCQYFKISFQSLKYVMALSEIRVMGPEGQDDPNYVPSTDDPSSDDPSSDDPSSEEPKDVTIGDINGDSKINSFDASLVLRYEVGLITELDNIDAADTNDDGKINSFDASRILRYEVGLITEF